MKYCIKNILLSLSLGVPALLSAQSVTYHHDPAVMNQFTVGETGLGNLQPNWYYYGLHRSYQSTASATNKQAQRLLTYYVLYREQPMAEQIDSALTDRAKIEALNITDRSGGVLDLAWQMEREKIENKQQQFKKNINQILFRGGTNNDYKYWTGIYNAVDCGLRAVKDAYMPNSQRKKQYLLIYKDLVQYNNQLVDCICVWAGLKQSKEYESGRTVRHPKPGDVARSAYGRWKIAMAGGSGISGGGSGHGGGMSAD